MQIKQKKCKGTGKCIGHGCNMPVFAYKFGLCRDCFIKWSYSTLEGEEFLKTLVIKSRKINQKEAKKEQSIKKEENRQKKIELMGVDKYRAEVVQPIINEIARLIDYGCPCIATGLYDGKKNGGHFIAVGSNRTLALNLMNIYMQSYESNGPKGGDNQLFRQGLIDTYGQEHLDRVEYLKRTPALHLTKADLIEVKERASTIRLELKNNLKYRTPEERIALRDELNVRIGIYKSIYHE